MHAPGLVLVVLLLQVIILPFSESTGLVDATGEESGTNKALGGIYTLYRKSVSWGDAQIYCEAHEGHLATFEDADDLKKVIDKIFDMSAKVSPDYLSGVVTAEFGLDRRYWIGLTDMVSGEGNWVWAGKGKPLLYNTMWYPGQPDHIDKDGKYIGRPEHCVALWNPIFHKGDRKHSLVDQECKRRYYFICEKDEKKLGVQQSWQALNQDLHDPKYPGMSGRSLAMLTNLRERKHNSHAATPSEPAVKTSMGRSMISLPLNPRKSQMKSKDKWRELAGFKELFEPSESSSMELAQVGRKYGAAKGNRLSKKPPSKLIDDEVNEIFSK